VKKPGYARLKWFAEGVERFRLSLSVDGGASRLLVDSASVTNATQRLRRGRHYVFKLTAPATGAVSVFSVRG
jgi:hypothetical protein